MKRRQQGVSLLGFIFVAAVVIVVVLVGARVGPAYIEYFAIKKTLQKALDDSPNATAGEIKRALDRRIGAEYIDSVKAADVEVTRTGNQVQASLSWQRVLPIVANASILLDFEATASR